MRRTGAWGQGAGQVDEPRRLRSRPARLLCAGEALQILASGRPRVRRGADDHQSGGVTHLDSGVLTLNAGSSSLKFAAFRLADGGEPNLLASGQSEGIGATAKGAVKTVSGQAAKLSFDRSRGPVDHAAAMGAILDWL